MLPPLTLEEQIRLNKWMQEVRNNLKIPESEWFRYFPAISKQEYIRHTRNLLRDMVEQREEAYAEMIREKARNEKLTHELLEALQYEEDRLVDEGWIGKHMTEKKYNPNTGRWE